MALRRYTPEAVTKGITGRAFKEGAQSWFNAGWQPLPVNNMRIPCVTGYHGKDRKLVSQELLDKWFKQYPEADLAVVVPEGVVVLDIDTHDEKNGIAEWDNHVIEHGEPGESISQSTRDPAVHGHRFYKFDPTLGHRLRKTLSGTRYVDIKGPGGFISVSPTKHHSLHTDYKWYDSLFNELEPQFVPNPSGFKELAPSWAALVEKPTVEYQARQQGALKRFTNRPGDKLNLMLDWDAVLDGYFEFTGLTNDVGHILRRVGSKNLTGAVLSLDTDKLLVFTSSYVDFLPPVDDGGAYTKYQAWTRIKLMDQGGLTEEQAFGPGSGRKVLEALGLNPDTGDVSDYGDMLYSYEDLEEEPVDYLWKGGLLLGALNLLAGKPGTGKSTFTYNLAADVTRGTVLGDIHGQPGVVVICSTEDSDTRVILPKLRAAGADMSKIKGVRMESMFTFPSDYDRVRKMVEHFDGAVKLIILDPLVNRIDASLDAHRDKDVRQALEPFQKLAEDFNLTVLGIVHNNKATDQDPLYSISGSTAFGGVSRATLSLTKADDYEETRERCVGIVKNNWGPDDMPAYRFTIDGVLRAATTTGKAIKTSKLVWVKKSDETQSEEIRKRKGRDQAGVLAKKEGKMDTAHEDMIAFLESNGPATAVEIDAEIRANPNTMIAVRRKARASGDVIYNTKSSKWCLPSQTFAAMVGESGLLPDGTALQGGGEVGGLFTPNDQGVQQILVWIATNPKDEEARTYAEENSWI